jgi:cellulose synthase/poly-beta-1,6-N-acetylglucosamine synthase-like glycosyltransferase
LLENVANQGESLGKYQVIIINNIPQKKLSQNLTKLSKKYQVINLKNLEPKKIYPKILDSCQGEIIVFLDGKYYPDENWLKEIIKPFDDLTINIVAGKIYLAENLNFLTKLIKFEYQFINKNKFKEVNFYDSQIGNIALRKNFINQQKYLNFTNINPKEISFYYRILREIEAEITYNPSAIIYS